jgi:hypothetical protein
VAASQQPRPSARQVAARTGSYATGTVKAAGSTGSAAALFLVVGGITLANEVVFAPVSSGGKITSDFNWRIIPATLLGAVALGGLQKIAPGFALGLAALCLLTVLIVPFGKAATPLENVSKMLGY